MPHLDAKRTWRCGCGWKLPTMIIHWLVREDVDDMSVEVSLVCPDCDTVYSETVDRESARGS